MRDKTMKVKSVTLTERQVTWIKNIQTKCEIGFSDALRRELDKHIEREESSKVSK